MNDPTTGAPLSLDEQQELIDHFAWKCAHPAAAEAAHGSTQVSGRGMSPNKVINGVGDVAAHLTITVGSVVWSTTASSLASGYKKLDCTSRQNNGPWSACGSAAGSGTSLSTRTNYICPPKGQEFEVEAWLRYNGADYWDDAWGITK
ncbi:hypothetical protein LLS1_18230 [Leifsonia sp. LS1]|nr:hypothetical protein LLS1_18230 [Leifsonia sp. LS1]